MKLIYTLDLKMNLNPITKQSHHKAAFDLCIKLLNLKKSTFAIISIHEKNRQSHTIHPKAKKKIILQNHRKRQKSYKLNNSHLPATIKFNALFLPSNHPSLIVTEYHLYTKTHQNTIFMLNQIAHTLPKKKYIWLQKKKITPKLQQTKTSTHNDHKSGNVIFCVSSLHYCPTNCSIAIRVQIILFRFYCYSLEANQNGETNY